MPQKLAPAILLVILWVHPSVFIPSPTGASAQAPVSSEDRSPVTDPAEHAQAQDQTWQISGSLYNVQPVLGPQSMLVIPVRFSDKANSKTVAEISEMAFSKMNSYYLEVSYGRMWFVGSVLAKWYLLPHTMGYYGADGSGFHDLRWRDLVLDSISVADSDVDYRQYRFVTIVHSGRDQATDLGALDTENVWSFAYGTGPSTVSTNDGLVEVSIAVVSEFDTLGTFAHETGHMLGLPDLYDTSYHQQFIGGWELMAEGSHNGPLFGLLGSVPAHISAWGKIKLGWIDVTQIVLVKPGLAVSVAVEQLQAKSSSSKAAILPVTQNQYFLIETRAKVGFDRWLPRQGEQINLLIYYVDETISSGNGPVRLQDIVSSPSTVSAGSALPKVEKTPYRIFITVLAASAQTFSLKVDYVGYSLIIRSGIANLPVSVDQETLLTDAAGNLNKRVSFSTHSIQATQVLTSAASSRRVFVSWGDGVTSTYREINVQSDVTLGLIYKNQHLLSVSSRYAFPVGSGWYDEGSIAYVSLDRTVIDTGPSSRVTFLGWTGDASGSSLPTQVVMDRPKTVSALWNNQFYLSIWTQPSSVATVPGAGWYDEGQSLTLNAPTVSGYYFVGWVLDGSPKLGSIVVLMSAPHNLGGTFAKPQAFAQSVEIASTSALSKYSYDPKTRVISFVVSGNTGAIGFSTVHIPKQLLNPGAPTVRVDGQVPIQSTVSEDGSYWILSFAYTHSDHLVTIPEFQSSSILLLAIVSTAFLILVPRHLVIWNRSVGPSRVALPL